MTKENYRSYMQNTSLLDFRSLSDLDALVAEFPYFQSAWLLYVKNLSSTEDVRFNNKIKFAALHAPDRLMLYRLLNEKPQQITTASNSISLEHEENAVPVDSGKKTTEKEQNLLSISNPSSGELIDFAFDTFEFITDAPIHLATNNQENTNVNDQKSSVNSLQRKNIQLIEQFISDKPKIIPKETEMAINTELPDYEKDDQDELISETLAQIYVKQGYFHKALRTYEKLSLKYPEKSIYFATQIKKIEELTDKNL